jgi:hypothetical protein
MLVEWLGLIVAYVRADLKVVCLVCQMAEMMAVKLVGELE